MNSKTIIFVIICVLAIILSLASINALATTIEVSNVFQLTNNNDRYDRNPSIINYGGAILALLHQGG